MAENNKVLIIGNIKEDHSKSMHVYLEEILRYLSNVDVISPSTKIRPSLYKIFIYPLKISKAYDVYHILDHSYGNLAYILPKNKLVITCHDLIPLKIEGIKFRARLSFKYYISGLRRARIILARSEATKKDIIKLLKIPEKRIRVLYFSFDPSNFRRLNHNKAKRSYGLRGKVVLISVGNFFYKNTLLILKAMKDLKSRYDNLLLVKIGGFSKEEEDFISENNLKDNVLVKKNISNEELNRYYNASDMLVFPSLYEGFGMPPLEAMACGTPVITSNVASLPEVVGDAAIKINPHSVEELKKAIIKIAENKKFRDSLVKKGFRNIKRFSIKEHAEKLEEIYKEVFESNNRNKNK